MAYLNEEGLLHLWGKITAADDTRGGFIKYDEGRKEVILYNKEGGTELSSFDASAFVKDGMLKSATLTEKASADNPLTINGVTYTNGEQFIEFKWNIDMDDQTEGTQDTMYVRVDDLGKTYSGSNSIEIGTNNSISVKEVDANITKLSDSIQVAGGPLANAVKSWPTGWKDTAGNNIIPDNLSLKQILEGLFLEVKNGTISWGNITWSPTMAAPTVEVKDAGGNKITSTKDFEVGSKVTVSYTAGGTISGNTRKSTLSFDPGYFNSLEGQYQDDAKVVSKTGSQSGTLTTTATWNGSSVASGDEVTVGTGTNTFTVAHGGITCSVDALDTTTVYGSTNTHVIVPELVATLTDSKPADKTPTNSASNNKVNGVRAYWVGSLSKAISAFDSATVRGLTSIKGIGSPRTSISVQQGHFQVVIITTKEISKVTSANQSGAAITSSFVPKGTYEIEGANGFEATTYHVYEYSVDPNGNGFNADTFTVTYK